MDRLEIQSFPAPPDGWNEFVDQHPEGKLYHKADWNQMIERTFGHRINYITMRRAGQIIGVLPLTDFKSLLFGHIAVSLPYINYGGLLLEDETNPKALFDYLETFRDSQNYKSIELRQEKSLNTDAQCKQHKVTFFLDLPEDADALLKSFKAKLRSQIRRPTKDGMHAKTGSVELLDDFYHVFTINMRDLGTPPLPRRFFKNILETFPDEARIVSVYTKDDQPAAASFLIKYGETMEIPWASSLREFNRSSPNMLLYWESLKLSIEMNCRRFDFGRCSPDSGTYRFKRQWGASESPLYWYYVLPKAETLPQMNPKNSKFDLFIKVWQKMPLSFTNSIGPLVIKHIP